MRILTGIQLALDKKREQALREVDEGVLKSARLNPGTMTDVVHFYAVVGEKEKALDWLEMELRTGLVNEQIGQSRLLASLHDDPRFKLILSSMASRRRSRQAALTQQGSPSAVPPSTPARKP